jgi:hypothetical protein
MASATPAAFAPRTALQHWRPEACEDSDVMLRGRKGPRRSARPMLSPLGFGMVRRDGSIYALGCVHIGGISYGVWALAPHVGGTPKHLRQEAIWTPPLYGVPHSGQRGDRNQSNGSLFFVRLLREPLRQHQRLDRRIPDEVTLTRAIAAGNPSAIRSKRLLIGALLSPMHGRNASGSLHHLHRDKVLE